MTCRCCLARLIAVFEQMRDDERAERCRARQHALVFDGADSDC